MNDLVEWVRTTLGENDFLSGGAVLMFLGAALAYCRKVPKQVWDFLVRRTSVTVEVRNDGTLFKHLEEWSTKQRFFRRIRDVVATVSRTLSPAPGSHLFFHKGRLVRLHRIRNEEKGAAYDMRVPEKIRLQFFFCRKTSFARDFVTEVVRFADPNYDNEIYIKAKKVQCWVKKKPRESVILPKENDVFEDVERFLSRASWYADRGLDYKRGYLLHGPPGNGKTSLVKTIASTFDLNLYVVNLGEMSSDSELAAAVAVHEPTVVLLEDVDCHALATKRKAPPEPEPEEEIAKVAGDEEPHEEKSGSRLWGPTMSGLLNAVDGVLQSEGRILFLTTNHPSKLDPALLRPGRVDRSIKIGNATSYQAAELYKRFFPEDGEAKADGFSKLANGSVCMAALQEKLILMSLERDCG